MKGRIKLGARIFQDHHFGKWPSCCPPQREYHNDETYKYEAKNPDMVFDVTWKGNYWDCVADGYGMLKGGAYGNGSIFVHDKYGVEIIC